MFALDLPFLLGCGFVLGFLSKNDKITQKTNWFLALVLLFIFQTGGIMFWFEILPGSKEFMIIPFNIILTTNDFEPLLAALLFGLEPIMIVMGEYFGKKWK
ncbi:MAG: hypothetical protein ACFE8U_07725 [Candidatus Hermodarchaeota archaeon]